MKRIATTCIAIAAVLTVGGCSSGESDVPAACVRAIDGLESMYLGAAEGAQGIASGDAGRISAADELLNSVDGAEVRVDVDTCRAAAE